MTDPTVMTRRELARTFNILWSVIAVLQFADVITTTTALRFAGGHEGNPLAQQIAQSPWLMLGTKVLLTTAGWMVMRFGILEGRGTKYATGCWAGSLIILVSYLVVIANNTHVLVSG